jgi:hypothetical protein
MADDGSFVIAWQESQYEVGAQAFNNSGVKIGRELLVNATTANFQFDPAVALQPSGFVVAWTSDKQDGSGYGVYAQRFATYTEPPASVGGVVFVDADDDNVRDAGETGRDGVAVTLFDEWGGVVGRATTADGGHYRFDEVRPGFAHHLQFTLPNNTFVFDAKDVGGDDAVDSDVNPATGLTDPFTLTAGAVDLTRFAGIVPLVSISGAAFRDDDADGVRDAGEAGLAGWTVFLDADGDGQFDSGERSIDTDASGAYAFTNLLPGDYRVEHVPLMRWTDTTPAAGHAVTLAPGQSAAIDFGAMPTAPSSASSPLGGETAVQPSQHALNYRLYDASGNPRGATFRVNETTAGDQNQAAVAMSPSGDFVVAWTSGTSDSQVGVVYARRYDAAGVPRGGEFIVDSGRFPAVAINGVGDFVVAWNGAVDSHDAAYAQRYAADGTPRGDKLLASTTAISGGTQGSLYGIPNLRTDVAMDDAGNFTVVWQAVPWGSDRPARIYARRFVADGSPVNGSDSIASLGLANDEYNPTVAMNAAGESVIAWQGPGPAGAGIYVNRYDPAGTRQGGTFIANTTAGGGFPQAGIDSAGNVVIAWQNSDGPVGGSNGNGIFARRFNGSGLPIGDQFHVNTQLPGEQAEPFVAVSPGGSFNIAWRANQGMFMQRYVVDAPPGLPAWLSGAGATWDAATHALNVSGPVTITGDPGADAPLITANGAAAVVTVAPPAGTVVNLGGLVLMNGAAAAINSDGAARTLVVEGAHFGVAATSRLDVRDNALVIRAGDPAAVRSAITSAFNHGAWNGFGIASTAAAAADPSTAIGYASNALLNKTSFAGVTGLTSSDVLVKFTYAGDANLDGQVDIGDLGLLSGNWQQSGKDWFGGDFTYEGIVDIADLGALAGSWQKGVGNPL